MSGLTEFAEKYPHQERPFHAIGAINKGVFGWTDVERGLGQKKIELNQEAEIVSLMGSISVNNQGQSNVHGHGTVALSDGSVKGGHCGEAHVSIIAEVFVTEEEGTVRAVEVMHRRQKRTVSGRDTSHHGVRPTVARFAWNLMQA